MAHVSEEKKKTVAEFVKLINSYPVIGVVNMANLPAKQIQGMRAKIRTKNAVLRMTKKRLMKIAFEQSNKKDASGLEKYMDGLPALIFTEENPFKLYGELQKTKSKAAAKAGQKAPKDISVKAGPTSFSPGPVIGQLGKFGIKTGIEGGKIVIKQDSVVAKKGDTINAELAGILARLGVEPMEIGLGLTAAYEEGMIYTSEVLFVDEKEYAAKICTSYNEAINLAVYTAYPTKDTMDLLISKAFKDARALAISQGILNSETAQEILKKAYLEMISLSSSLPDEALSEELKGSKSAESHVPSGETQTGKEDHQKKTEEKKPEEASFGLGSLFG